MEFPSIYSSAKLAKSGLLAAELAVSEVFRAHPFSTDDDGKLDADGLAELAELWDLPRPVPAPAEPAPVTRRQREPSLLTKALREAKKAGMPVANATLTADGSVSLSFGEAVKSNGNDLDRWLAKKGRAS
jgi:hypothetical protein